MTITRRSLMQSGALTAGALALGPAFWRDALAASPTRVGPGPYGPIGAPDANGLRLPQGFTSKILARAGQPVPGTAYVWPPFPDGKASFATPDGGWYLAVNSEVPGTSGNGGASAIRFRPDGTAADAYRILGGTNMNCSGGPTPWGTWLSCEETGSGRVWECDPTGARTAVARPAMGLFSHEAAAVDPGGKRVYLTEDVNDGLFYRFTPAAYPDLAAGTLEAAIVGGDGKVTWRKVDDPSGASKPTRQQVAGAMQFKRGEGIWFDSGVVYVGTTTDSKVHAYDTRSERYEVLYDASALGGEAPLTDVDNITAGPSGDLYVCEDSGGADPLDIVVITPDREVARLLKLTGPEHNGSEITGAAFDPSGKRLYFTSQRGFGIGVTFEVTGPFRTQRVAAPSVGSGPGAAGAAGVRVEVLRAGFTSVTVAITSDRALPAARLALRANVSRRGRRRAPLTLVRLKRDLPAGRTRVVLRLPADRRRLLRARRGLAARLDVVAGDAVTRQAVRLKR